MKIVGYTNRLSAAPGDVVEFMVSSSEPTYRANLVELRHGDDNALGPGFKEIPVTSAFDGPYPGRLQSLRPGSYVSVPDHPSLRLHEDVTVQLWVWPTTPTAGEQALVSGPGYNLHIDASGRVVFGGARTVRPLRARQWYFVCATRNGGISRLDIAPIEWSLLESRELVEAEHGEQSHEGSLEGSLTIGARRDGAHFNGKLESPRLFARSLTPAEVETLLDGGSPCTIQGLVASWNFAIGMGTRVVHDQGPLALHGRAVNMPTRGVTGHTWARRTVDPADAPDQYAAIHFHDDDLDDAGWSVDFAFEVPDELRSGIYAARLEAGDAEDYLPFVVRPPRGRATAPIALLLPTFSYLAYANEHMLTDPVNQEIFANFGTAPDYPSQPQDVYIVRHRLASLYDVHSDGSGVCYASRLRPLLNMRPKYNFMLLANGRGAPHQLNADLHLVDWLHARGFAFDVLTDDDLHAEGSEALRAYRAIVSGSHHEYWSAAMLDGMASYLAGGGRFLYLSGNGMFWVTGLDPDEGHTIEVRRFAATRSWEAEPGEWHLSTTGELGGPWRYRGRAPQRLLGVGYAAEGFDRGRPYVRQPDSFDERAAFVFAGIGDEEEIGAFPTLVTDWGAAGYEIDRFDIALGAPAHALLLASATGFSDGYQHALEENFASDSRQGGSVNPYVRADMCLLEYPNDGAVFSTGSIAWCSALSYNEYDNNVSRITQNVLEAFSSPRPLPR